MISIAWMTGAGKPGGRAAPDPARIAITTRRASIIANEAYRPRRGYYYDDYAYDGPYYYPSAYSGDPRVVCAQNFRSFEWNTGLYTTYGGERRLCPYLK